MKRLLLSLIILSCAFSAMGQALSGIYTINNEQATADRNFNTFEEAITTLNTLGTSGFVTFVVKCGQTFQISGLQITGTYYYTLEFRNSLDGDRPLLKITPDPNASEDVGIILNGSNIRIDGFEIEHSETSNALTRVGISIMDASNIWISNCNIRRYPRTRASGFGGISYGIATRGGCYEVYVDDVQVQDNDYGFDFAGGHSVTINHCSLFNVGTGISCMNSNNLSISQTQIHDATDGIRLVSGDNVRIYNNTIHAYSNGVVADLYSPFERVYFAHNTVYISDNWNSVNNCFTINASDASIGFYNNIFVNKARNINALCISNSWSSDNQNILPGSNNNIFFCKDGAIYNNANNTLIYTVSEYADLLGDGRENASWQEDVPFYNAPYNFDIPMHVPTGAESGGQDISALAETDMWRIDTDIRGFTRPGDPYYYGTGTAPDIGAYEFEGIKIASILESEYNSLKAFYLSTNGSNWIQQWDCKVNDLHQRKWKGVTVDAGHVVSIELPANNLTGIIPDLTDLPYLQTLDVSYNAISGIDGLLSPSITFLSIREQRLDGGTFILNGETTDMPVPNYSTYDHFNQDFNYVPRFDIYQSSTKINYSPLTSVEVASFFNNMNDRIRILSGANIELCQTYGVAAGTTMTYTINYRMGDSNIDGLVNVQDMQKTLNYINFERPAPFNFGAANMHDDAIVNIQDLVQLVNYIQTHPIETRVASLRSAALNDEDATDTEGAGYAELQLEDGIVYLVSPVDIAAFDIRISGTASVENIKKLIDNPDMQVAIRGTDDTGQISVLVYSLGGHVLHAGRTPLFTVNIASKIEQALLTTKSAQLVNVRISNSPTKNNHLPEYKAQCFNAPNPFSEATTFVYYLSEPANSVRIKIYNPMGQLVDIISDLPADQGQNKAAYRNNRLPAGIYIYVLETYNNNTYSIRQTNRMIINK